MRQRRLLSGCGRNLGYTPVHGRNLGCGSAEEGSHEEARGWRLPREDLRTWLWRGGRCLSGRKGGMASIADSSEKNEGRCPRRVTLGGGARDQHNDFNFSEKAQKQSSHRRVLSPPRAATPAVGSVHMALRADAVLESGSQAQQVKALGGTQGSWYSRWEHEPLSFTDNLDKYERAN